MRAFEPLGIRRVAQPSAIETTFDVPGEPHLVELGDGVARADQRAQPQAGEADLGQRAQDEQPGAARTREIGVSPPKSA